MFSTFSSRMPLSSAGIVPSNLLFCKNSCVSLTSAPSVLGIEPSTFAGPCVSQRVGDDIK
jgi:hypothetical protein